MGGGQKAWGAKGMGGKRHGGQKAGGQKAWGAKGRGEKDRGAKDRRAKDRGAKDRGAKVLEPGSTYNAYTCYLKTDGVGFCLWPLFDAHQAPIPLCVGAILPDICHLIFRTLP